MSDYIRDAKLDRATTKHVDHHGRRITNAGDAINDRDYVTLKQLKSAVGTVQTAIDNTKSGGGMPTGGIVVPPANSAPSMISAGSSVSHTLYQLLNISFYNFTLTLVLPTSDPNYGQLVAFNIYDDQISTTVPFERVDRPAAGWGTSPLIHATVGNRQDVNSHLHTLTIRSVNSDGIETSPGITLTDTIPAAQAADIPPVGTISIIAVSITENTANRYRAPDRTSHGILDITTTFTINYGVLNYTLYYSPDNGTSWYWTGVYPMSGTSATIHIDKICPNVNTSIKVQIVPGKVSGDPSAPTPVPSGGTISSSYSFAAINNPANNVISSASPGTAVPTIDPDGTQDWMVTGCTFTDANPVTDPYAFETHLLVRVGKIVLGTFTPATSADGGDLQLQGIWPVDGTTHIINGIDSWGFPSDTTMDTVELTLVVYTVNGLAVTQKCWSGGTAFAGYVNFGGSAAKLKATRLDPTTLDGTVTPNTGGGTFGTSQTQNSTSLLRDWNFAISAASGSLVTNPPIWNSPSGTVTISSSGGPNNCAYARLVTAFATISQNFPVNPSQPLYFQVATRASGSGSVSLSIGFLNSAGSSVGTVVVGTVSSGGWNLSGIVGTILPSSIPSTAVKAIFSLQNGFSSSNWDVTLLIARQVVQETNSGQTTTNGPQPSSSPNTDQSGTYINSTSTSAVAFYGLLSCYLKSPNGVNMVAMYISNTSANIQASFGTGVTLQAIQLECASGISRVSLQRNATISAGVDTTISGHSFLGGICVS